MKIAIILFVTTLIGIGLAKPKGSWKVHHVGQDSGKSLPIKKMMQILRLDKNYTTEEVGVWGDIQVCPDNTFASAFQVKFHSPDHLDETAINGLKLLCSYANDTGILIDYVQSSTGIHGQWYDVKFCPNHFITGFRANILSYQGLLVDDVAVENIQVDCNHGEEILDPFMDYPEGIVQAQKYLYGEWSSLSTCNNGYAVCGIQTLIEEIKVGDEVGLVDAILYCCKI